MPQRAKLLYMLQRIDTQLAIKQRRYHQVQQHLGENDALKTTRATFKAAEQALSQARGSLRDHELEAEGVAEKVQETNDLLYGGKVTNPKELSDLQKESEYLKRRESALEERLFEEMMNVEQLTAKAAVANEEYVVVEAAWRSENADLGAEYESLKQELTKLLGQRKALSKHISGDDMAEYDALRRLRKGRAVVAVKDGSCLVCRVEVPQRDLKRAETTDDLYYCSGCERILYVPES